MCDTTELLTGCFSLGAIRSRWSPGMPVHPPDIGQIAHIADGQVICSMVDHGFREQHRIPPTVVGCAHSNPVNVPQLSFRPTNDVGISQSHGRLRPTLLHPWIVDFVPRLSLPFRSHMGGFALCEVLLRRHRGRVCTSDRVFMSKSCVPSRSLRADQHPTKRRWAGRPS